MGYYSEVFIKCESKAYEMLKETWEKVDFKPHSVKVCHNTELPDDYVVEWNWVKWYGRFDDVAAIESVCSKLCEDEYTNKKGYGFKKIVIGEDNATEEEGNETGWDELDFYTHIEVDIPDDAEEIKF